ISAKLGVSRGALSYWLANIPYTPNAYTAAKIKNSLIESKKFYEWSRLKKENEAHLKAERIIKNISSRDLLLCGIGLYFGEGTKTQNGVSITNSDPAIIRLAVKWLTVCFHVPPQNFQVHMHLYPDCNEQACKEYWQKVCGTSDVSFIKPHYDLRKKIRNGTNYRVLKYGTVNLRVRTLGNPEFGAQLHRLILAIIQRVSTSAGIV
ncbi:MAG TPA: hypothetical protein VLA04_03805, partial [Verrucomicrobiae bacterium]|nr:hypothetical protein [Verrucomicrobiae bacterium]